MEAVLNKDPFPVDDNDGRSHTKNGSKRVIAHTDTTIAGQAVGNECRLVGQHVVSSACVGNKEA